MTTDKHIIARDAYANKDYQTALEAINDILDDNPNDSAALFILGGILIQTNKKGLAYNIYARCAKQIPESAEVWGNFGRCQSDDPDGWNKSMECFNKSLELNPESYITMANISSLYLQQCKPKEALMWAFRSLSINPDYNVAQSCLGFCYLYLGEWDKGFEYYHAMTGHASRPHILYNDLPEWDGTPGQTIIVNGEQGIGDEIVFSSLIPDIAKNNRVVYDCMPRLESLMKRSMPDNVFVVGGRWKDEIFLPENFQPTARITQAGLGKYCRKTDSDFNGDPYLVADKDMRKAMRGLLDSLGSKPKIGIAWTGGTKQSRMHFRNRTLEDLTPLLRNDSVTWISLEYKDKSIEIEDYFKARNIKIHHYPFITEIKEYDMTAALVAELDLVIAVPTTVTQLAGAMGVQAWVIVPEITGWLFNLTKYVWAKSVKTFRAPDMKAMEINLHNWLISRSKKNAA
jgi:Tfp pilus assembly protein PilF